MKNRYNRWVFAMCGLAGLLYGIDLGLIAAALPYIRETCDFSQSQTSSIVAAGPVAGWLIAGGFVFFIAAYGVGPGVCVWLANSELMPLRIRARGMVVNGLGNAATSFAIAQAFLPWSAACGEASVFFTLAGVTVLYLLTVVLLLPETKGKTLEEIERHFAGGMKS